MNKYTQLARQTIETYAKTGKIIPVPRDLPEEFYIDRKGVFITIYKNKNGRKSLRGCVGTFEPVQKNIAEEIIQNAIWASQKDNRFQPVIESELDNLNYEVSLLNPPEQIYATKDLNPEKFGVIIKTRDDRCGLLLPNIEGIDSPLHQIEIAAQKGCIDFHREEFSLFRFTVTKYKE